MFRQLAIDQPRTLIVDIRENGGDDGIAAEFFRHITEKPFRLMGRTQVNAQPGGQGSRQITPADPIPMASAAVARA